ncbi:hypothetical protein [Natronobiforma cellulositropha]|nr:hypothetical protein [Natronobiforma cellulositropha]
MPARVRTGDSLEWTETAGAGALEMALALVGGVCSRENEMPTRVSRRRR